MGPTLRNVAYNRAAMQRVTTKLLLSLTLLLTICAGASPLFAQTGDTLLNQLEPGGYVNDFANVMGAERGQLEPLLAELEQKTGAQVTLVTLPSLQGGEITDFANRLFERWGIGRAGEDNGVLILTSIEERRIWIEVGYGLEPIIPDARAGRILDEAVIPFFREEQFGTGMAAGAASIASIIAADAGVELTGAVAIPTPRQTQGQRSPLSGLLRFLFLLILIPIFIRNPWLALFLLSSGRGGGFGGGGFGRGGGGGGFGGFGGGMSGGGGAGRSW